MSRVNYKLISNKKAVPVFKSNLFSKHKDRRFVAISLGFGLYPKDCDERLFFNYLRLRKNVYVDQTGMLDNSVVLDDNTEVDDDDDRSLHIVVVENRGGNRVAVVGCQRLIIRQDNRPLPVEVFYPEIFSHGSRNNDSAEVSRYISRVEKGYGYNYEILSVMAKIMLSYASQHKIRHIYGVIEEELEQAFKKARFPFRRIADPKIVEEYNDYNLGIEIDIRKYSFLLKFFVMPKIEHVFDADGRMIFWGKYKQTG